MLKCCKYFPQIDNVMRTSLLPHVHIKPYMDFTDNILIVLTAYSNSIAWYCINHIVQQFYTNDKNATAFDLKSVEGVSGKEYNVNQYCFQFTISNQDLTSTIQNIKYISQQQSMHSKRHVMILYFTEHIKSVKVVQL